MEVVVPHMVMMLAAFVGSFEDKPVDEGNLCGTSEVLHLGIQPVVAGGILEVHTLGNLLGKII